VHELIDIGVNLAHDSFDEDRDEVLARALAAGITRLIVTGTSVTASVQALALAEQHPGTLYATAGVHPHNATQLDDHSLAALRSLARSARVVAIGECGLDFFRDYSPRSAQRRAFEAQLELAARVGLPVVIHTRAAEDDTFALLREHSDSIPAVIMHCFSAADRLDECVERGYLCSFAGNVTYPKASDLQQAARDVPAELLLVETDSPYLAPQPVRGKPNEPANVAHTARFVAELRGVGYEELERTVDANAERVFGP
jgi:TatD DNase family protein